MMRLSARAGQIRISPAKAFTFTWKSAQRDSTLLGMAVKSWHPRRSDGKIVMSGTPSIEDNPFSQAELLERLHLVLLDDAHNGLADVAAGCVEDADLAPARMQTGHTPENSAN